MAPCSPQVVQDIYDAPFFNTPPVEGWKCYATPARKRRVHRLKVTESTFSSIPCQLSSQQRPHKYLKKICQTCVDKEARKQHRHKAKATKSAEGWVSFTLSRQGILFWNSFSFQISSSEIWLQNRFEPNTIVLTKYLSDYQDFHFIKIIITFHWTTVHIIIWPLSQGHQLTFEPGSNQSLALSPALFPFQLKHSILPPSGNLANPESNWIFKTISSNIWISFFKLFQS